MAPTAAYDVGDKRRLQVTFKDAAGTDTDPTTVEFTIREPDGTATTYTSPNANLVNSATGIWHVDWTIAQEQRHHYEFVGTGTVVTSEAGEFYARRKNTA